MEVVGGVATIAAIADQLLQACLTGYQLFTAAQNVGKDFEGYLYRLGVSQQKLKDWISEVESDGKKLHDFIDPNSFRYQLLLQTLARIAGTFAEVEQLKSQYGIFRVDEVADAKDTHVRLTVDELYPASASSAEPPRRERILRRLRSTFNGAFRPRSNSPAPPARLLPGTYEKAGAPLNPTHALVRRTSTGDVPGPTMLEETDLDRIVPGLDKWAEDVKKRAAKYQQTIPTLARYKWAYTGGKQPLRLVEDLETHVGCLESLTRYPLERLKSAHTLKFPAPFDEFKVQWQLPYPPLDNFCGREDILQEMEDFFNISNTEKSSAGKRAVVLQGMGGIGKSQIALKYVYRNPEAYAAVFWVNATDQSTICDSGRQILQMLIAHYSTKYRGKHNFADIATDLGIPGQVKNDGMLMEEVARAPWPSVKMWLARESNSRWCLIVDGLNVPEDEDRMRELLPACDHGHVIVTSRVPVAGSKLIDIPEMDETSSPRLLLHDTFETASRENRKAAKSIAKELGYLPLALSQAAAYMVKCALGFVEYLKRLMKNMAIYISERIPRYPQGVVSCWQLSVQALMESKTTHSIDLLRLCSFLSPDGVSRELLVRGLSAMEWFGDDESQLDHAIDNLVMYALIRRKSSNNLEEGQAYWIHPLVRHWAQDAYSDSKSMVLETDKTRLQKLHTNGYLQAISVVGCGLNTRYDNREKCEWNFERRNMTHVSLCLDTYIPKCDFMADNAAAAAKVALALTNFSGLKYYWGEYHASASMAELSVSLYKRLMPANPPPDLEAEMLLAKQHLIMVNVYCRGLTNPALLEETLLRQRQLLAPGSAHLLWTESLKASELALEGRRDEALDQYKRCMAKTAEALDPGHPVNMATIYNLAVLYDKIGDQPNAEKLYDQSVKLYLKYRGLNHQDTHIVLQNIASVRGRKGNYEGELECLKIVADGSEETYGLGNQNTMKALRRLEYWYRNHGQESEAKALSQKIQRGRILSDASILDKEGIWEILLNLQQTSHANSGSRH